MYYRKNFFGKTHKVKVHYLISRMITKSKLYLLLFQGYDSFGARNRNNLALVLKFIVFT